MADETFQVLVPNDPPKTGHTPSGNGYASLDAAMDAARPLAVKAGRFASVLVNKLGTDHTWSVQYHPEAPFVKGIDPHGNPNVVWPVEFRITTDLQTLKQTFDEDGTEVSREWTGKWSAVDEVPEPVEA